MEVAARSYFATGIALVGAGVIAVSPVVPKPDVHLPALPAAHAVPVELTALESPLQLITELIQQSVNNVITLGGRVISDPAPILTQILKNQVTNADDLATDLRTFIANSATAISQDVPQQLQMARGAFSQGQITDGLNDLVGAVLLPILGDGLSNLLVIQDVFSVLARPAQNVVNLINAGPTILLDAAIAPIIVLSNFVNAIGNGAEGVIAAVKTGNPVTVATALADGAIGLVAAGINSVIDPNSGLIASFLNVRDVIAQALGAPAPAAVKVAAANELPAAAAKTLTLSTATDATTTSTKDAATSDKDADSSAASGSVDTKSATPNGSDTSSAATDSSTTTSTESKSGTDADGKDAVDGKDSTDARGDSTGKGDANSTKGSDSTSSSTSTGKADNDSKKAAGRKDSAGATSSHKAAHKK